MKPDDIFFLRIIMEEIQILEDVQKGLTFRKLLVDPVTQRCIGKSLENIGETTKRVSEEVKERCPLVRWSSFRILRNQLAHEYFSVDWELIWNTLKTRIPLLKSCIKRIINE